MEKIFEQTLLYDFYGELLNEHQRNVYEDAVFNDLSLSEIADNYDISRQAAHDLLKRVNKLLEGYENKLHMIQRFRIIEKYADEIISLTDEVIEADDENSPETDSRLLEIRNKAGKITEVMTEPDKG